jgi:hypothetical protein
MPLPPASAPAPSATSVSALIPSAPAAQATACAPIAARLSPPEMASPITSAGGGRNSDTMPTTTEMSDSRSPSALIRYLCSSTHCPTFSGMLAIQSPTSDSASPSLSQKPGSGGAASAASRILAAVALSAASCRPASCRARAMISCSAASAEPTARCASAVCCRSRSAAAGSEPGRAPWNCRSVAWAASTRAFATSAWRS